MGNHSSVFNINFNPGTDPDSHPDIRIHADKAYRYQIEADRIEKMIRRFYPLAKITRNSQMDIGGGFEVAANGQLVHSKISGQGFIDDPRFFMRNLRNVVEGTSTTSVNDLVLL